MIKDSNNKKFDVVLVWKLDRFARNKYDSVVYKNRLKKNGVKVISVTEYLVKVLKAFCLNRAGGIIGRHCGSCIGILQPAGEDLVGFLFGTDSTM